MCLLRGTDWIFIYIILRSAHTVYLCVLCGSENKQRLFPYTALTGWFLRTVAGIVYCAVRTDSLYKADCVTSLKG